MQKLTQKLFLAFMGCLVCFAFVYKTQYCNLDEQTSSDENKDLCRKSPVVTVDVFYESLCPDSKSFFATEVKPTHDVMSEWITWTFIPFGKASIHARNNVTYLRCQHGLRECEGNKYHACIIRKSSNSTQLVNVLTCIFSRFHERMNTVAEKCCQRYNFDFKSVQTCAIGTEGMELIAQHMKSTDKIVLRFVPTIVLNKIQGPTAFQSKILKSLRTEVCNVLKYEGVTEIESICTDVHNYFVR